MSDFVMVARVEEVAENGLHAVDVQGRKIVLINQGGSIFALEDRCSHEEFPLSAGEVAGGQVTCALHGARFDLETGAPMALPAVTPVKIYELRIDGGEIRVRLDG